MPKIDLDAVEPVARTGYPAPYDAPVRERFYQRLTVPAGVADFAVNRVTLAPGAWSSQRHWHEREDEFLVMLAGEAVLVDDTGRTPLGAGDCAAFPKGGNGHHLVNESTSEAVFIVVGAVGVLGPCHYPDIDLELDGSGSGFRHKDGRPY